MADPSKPNAKDEALIRALRRDLPNMPAKDRAKWEPRTKGVGKATKRGK